MRINLRKYSLVDFRRSLIEERVRDLRGGGGGAEQVWTFGDIYVSSTTPRTASNIIEFLDCYVYNVCLRLLRMFDEVPNSQSSFSPIDGNSDQDEYKNVLSLVHPIDECSEYR